MIITNERDNHNYIAENPTSPKQSQLIELQLARNASRFLFIFLHFVNNQTRRLSNSKGLHIRPFEI